MLTNRHKNALTVSYVEDKDKRIESYQAPGYRPSNRVQGPEVIEPTTVSTGTICANCSYRDLPNCPMRGSELCARIRGEHGQE